MSQFTLVVPNNFIHLTLTTYGVNPETRILDKILYVVHMNDITL